MVLPSLMIQHLVSASAQDAVSESLKIVHLLILFVVESDSNHYHQKPLVKVGTGLLVALAYRLRLR